MPLFDDIDTHQKLQILEATRKSLEHELFENLARLGIDFDSYEFGQHPDWADDPGSFPKRRVIELEAAITTVSSKISSLSS